MIRSDALITDQTVPGIWGLPGNESARQGGRRTTAVDRPGRLTQRGVGATDHACHCRHGWNRVCQHGDRLFRGSEEGAYFYSAPYVIESK